MSEWESKPLEQVSSDLKLNREVCQRVLTYFYQHVLIAIKIKRHLLLGRKAMTNPVSVLKSRAITLLTKVHIVKAMVFSVVLYGCESWTIKKAESRRTDTFELWYRRLWRVPWTDRRFNQSILKEISPDYSLD